MGTRGGTVVAGAEHLSDGVMARMNPTVPHSARIWNYWLGGKDYYAADREAGDKVLATYPGIKNDARQAREFLVRAVKFLTGECGISQFLDIGTGLPTSNNTHQVAQGINPGAVVPTSHWRPTTDGVNGLPEPVDAFCGVARNL